MRRTVTVCGRPCYRSQISLFLLKYIGITMTREETIKTIKNYLSQYPIIKIGIFGSYARGEEKEDSDIDMNKSTVNHTTYPPK